MGDTVVETAPGDENDDSWLYGESTGDQVGDKSAEEDKKEHDQTDAAEDGAVSNLYFS